MRLRRSASSTFTSARFTWPPDLPKPRAGQDRDTPPRRPLDAFAHSSALGFFVHPIAAQNPRATAAVARMLVVLRAALRSLRRLRRRELWPPSERRSARRR